MTKRPFGHGDIRNMSNFKAIAMDYAYYSSLSDEGRLYCLTDQQVYILLAQLDYVGWLTRWYNTEDITQTTVGYIRAQLEEDLLNCIDISVLVDQGKINLTRSVQNQQVQSAGLRQVYDDRYDGTPTSINPDAPTTNFGASGDRYDALCAALMAFVYQYAKAQAEAVIAGQITAFAALSLIAVLLIPGLNVFYLAGAAIALIAGGGIVGVSTSVAIAALTDTSALNEVVCYMRDTLKGQSVTQANFAASLVTYPFSVGTHAAIVADFLKATLNDNYLCFLDMLGQAYSGTINNEPLPECPCEEPPITDWVYLNSGTYNPRPGVVDYLGGTRYRAYTWSAEGDNNFVLTVQTGGTMHDFVVSNAVVMSGIPPQGGELNPPNAMTYWYVAWTAAQGAQIVEFNAELT